MCRLVLPYEVGLIGGRFLRAKGRVWDLMKAEVANQVPLNSCLIEGNRLRSVEEDRVVTRSIIGEPLDEFPTPVPLEGLADESQVWPLLHLTGNGQTVWGPAADGTGLFAGEIIAKGIRLWDADTGALRRTLDFAANLHVWPGLDRDGKLLAASSYGDNSIRIWPTTSDHPALEIKHECVMDGQIPAFSPDGSRVSVASHAGGKDAVVIYGTDDGRRITSFPTGLNPQLTGAVVRFSSSGRYLLVTRKIWDWLESKKLATLYLLPGHDQVFVNHITGHFSGRAAAHQYLRTDFERPDGRKGEVTLREYEQGTGWKNDPKKAGLDLEKRNKNLAENGQAE